MMHVEVIRRNGRKFAVLPFKELEALVEEAEMLADIRAFDEAKRRVESGEDELIPFSLVKRRINGENVLKIWREYRGFTQEMLARRAKVSRAMIAAIEAGHKRGGVLTLKKLAAALDMSLDQLA